MPSALRHRRTLAGFQAAAAACLAHDALPQLPHLPTPALVLAGRHDILTRTELSTEIVNTMPHAQLQVLDAGHMTFREAPEAWSHSVTHWLNEHQAN